MNYIEKPTFDKTQTQNQFSPYAQNREATARNEDTQILVRFLSSRYITYTARSNLSYVSFASATISRVGCGRAIYTAGPDRSQSRAEFGMAGRTTPSGIGDRVEALVCNYGPLDRKTPGELYEDGAPALCPQGTVRSSRYRALCRKCFILSAPSPRPPASRWLGKPPVFCVFSCARLLSLPPATLVTFLGYTNRLTTTNFSYEQRENRFRRAFQLLAARELCRYYYNTRRYTGLIFTGDSRFEPMGRRLLDGSLTSVMRHGSRSLSAVL